MGRIGIKHILAECCVVLLLVGAYVDTALKTDSVNSSAVEQNDENNEKEEKSFIKWVEFNVSYEALQHAYEWDVQTYEEVVHLNWIDLLAYLGAKYGGDFTRYKQSDMDTLANTLTVGGETIATLTASMEYYDYYSKAYGAVLNGMVGEYEIQAPVEGAADDAEPAWTKKYGLKAYSPIAKGYAYNDYDDFGSSRTYGYKRNHLGHDMMGLVGTPITAIESGYVEALGWNQYGGWRIGIRSFDGLRYYYYAHLRQNFPFNKSLEEGSVVTAGDVIGYMGHTGYSTEENVNNIDETHLHWGLQLIFDESQKEGNNEIWVDCYALTRFLSQNRSESWKEEETKEYHRTYEMKDPAVTEYIKKGK